MAQVGDTVVLQGMPGTVVKVQMVGGVQYDTVLFEQPVVRVVLDSQVQTGPPPVPTPAPPAPTPHATPAPTPPPAGPKK